MKNNTRSTMKRIEGYWKEYPAVVEFTLSNGLIFRKEMPAKTTYPDPIPNTLTQKEAETIYTLIVEKQTQAEVVSYMGSSKSRITGEPLGNKEYQTEEWIWPGDFAYHYVLTHRVKPSEDFLKWIGFYQ